MSEWKEYKLRDVCLKIGSGATPTGGGNSYKLQGISLIRSQNILDFQFSRNGLAFIDDEQAYDLRNVTVEKDDILLNITGDSVARACKVSDSILPARVNQHVSLIRANKGLLDPGYLLYYLQSTKPYLLSISEIGATRRALTKGMIEDLDISIPPLPEQKSIASILSSLDDKIDLLHRQNQTLETLAETLFRQWFVEEAEESWETGKLGDFGEFKNGVNYSRDEAGNTTFGIINVRDVMGNKFIFKEAIDEINIDFRKAEPYLLKKFDIVIVRSASPGETALILENQKKLIYSGFTIRFRPHKEREAFFFFQLMQSIKKQLDIFSDGTTLKNLNQEILKNIEFQVPSFESIETFNEKVEPIFNKISKNITQIRTLTHLRDTLLPKLMSGEVRVKMEEIV